MQTKAQNDRKTANYFTNLQATWILFDIQSTDGQSILDLFKNLDRSHSGFVSLPRFSSCYCGKYSKLSDFIVKSVLMIMIDQRNNQSSNHGWLNEENKLSYFAIIQSIIILSSLNSNEYCAFVFWCALRGEGDVMKDNVVEVLQTIAEMAVSFSGENEKVKAQFLKWKKLLEQVEDANLDIKELSSIDMRSGGPITTMMVHMMKVFRESTFGAQAWKRITNNVRKNVLHLKAIYTSKFKESKPDFMFDVDVFNKKKGIREEVRSVIRLHQSFFGIIGTEKVDNSSWLKLPFSIPYFRNTNVTEQPEDGKNLDLQGGREAGSMDISYLTDVLSLSAESIVEKSKRLRYEASLVEIGVKNEFNL